MSRSKGTAEKSFTPLYVDGQDAADFEKRAWQNMTIAREGAVVEPKYMKARGVKFAFMVIKRLEAIIQNSPDDPAIEGRKAVILRARKTIDEYVEDALRRSDAASFRLLAEVFENPGSRSPDALNLIEFCRSMPLDYVFTFKELLHVVGKAQCLKFPYDEAVEQRTRRLIKAFKIRTQKRQ